MPAKFEVRLTEKEMFDFLLNHHYTHAAGILSTVLGIVSFIVGVVLIFDNKIGNSGMWFAMAVIFIFFNRQTLKNKAKLQAKKSPMINKPLICTVSDEGVNIRQETETATTSWEEFTKIVSTKKSVILYIGRMRAFIFPREQMGDNYEIVLEYIYKNLPKEKIRLRRKDRRRIK